MGGQSSKFLLDQSSKIVSETYISQVQDCSSVTNVNQIINIEGNNIEVSDVELVQDVLINKSCLNESNVRKEMASQIEAKLKTVFDNNQELGSILSRSENEINAKISNFVSSVTSQEFIQDCSDSTNLNQILNVKGNNISVDDVSMEQTVEIFSKCVQASTTKVLISLDSRIKSKSKIKTEQSIAANTVGAIGDAISGFVGTILQSAMLPFILIILFIVAAVIIVRMLGLVGGKSDSDSKGENSADISSQAKSQSSENTAEEQQSSPEAVAVPDSESPVEVET